MRKIVLTVVICMMLSTLQPALSSTRVKHQKLKQELVTIIDQKSPLLIEVSDKVWECAEIALEESQSAEVLAEVLEKEGFRVDRGVADLPTAFVATYGSGKPIIGILAEYDALPGLSQDSTPFKKVLVEEGAGHGCGHNLFGAGSLGAALAIKKVIAKGNIKGTVRLYGCPAEEDVGGKLFMAREGLFDDLDACLAWHPAYKTAVDVEGSQAITDLEIEFHGRTAHAAFDPWMGNSALDAVEMLLFGVNLLREHVKPSVRIHYVIQDGGKVPNIVPEYARVWLWIRDSNKQGVKTVQERVNKIVEGAAVATGTESNIDEKGSFYEMLVNRAGAKVMQKNLEWIGPITYTSEEIAYAKRIQKESGVEEKGMVSDINPLKETPKDPEGGSTDVAEVSWITPTLHLSTTCAPFGIPWHSWAVVTASKHPIGYKGLILAAKTMATTALDLLLEEDIRIEMRKEFDEKLNGRVYESGLKPGQKPPTRVKKDSKK